MLGEFGGLGLRLEGHVWIPEDSFSYQMMNSPAELEVSQPRPTLDASLWLEQHPLKMM